MGKRPTTALTERPAPKQPVSGEVTQAQGVAGVSSAIFPIPGFDAPLAGTYQTYRMMRRNPTIAIARMAATAPIKAADWSFEKQDDAPNGAMELIEAAIEPVLRLVVREMTRALDYGFQSFELVWELQDTFLVPHKIKPLIPDKTQIVIDKSTGAFAGLKQGAVELEPAKSLLFTYDGEGSNFYGRSRMENCRDTWSNWRSTVNRIGRYVGKVSGVIPMVRYPIGSSQDADGAKQSNFDLATKVLQQLGQGHGVAWPVELAGWAEDMVRQGVDPEKLYAWRITFLESKGQHGQSLMSVLKGFDVYLIRGWLVPERAVTEGQHGTKAEAEAHIDVAILGAEEVLQDIALTINWHLIDKILILNYGPEAAGTVKVTPAPLVDAKRQLVRTIMEKVLTQPGTADLLLAMLNIDAMIEQSGLPKREEGEESPITLPGPERGIEDVMASVYGEFHRRVKTINLS